MALACNIIGSILIAVNIGMAPVGYVFFTVGVIPATYLLLVSNANRTLVLTNLYFFGVNILGIFRHWGI